MAGNFELIIDDQDEVRPWLRSSNDQVNDWLYELVDSAVFYAAQRLRALAPGRIGTELVDVDLPVEHTPGVIEGAAGVEPDITQETFGRGLGSDPADFPFFVEVGTGIYGESGTPIRTIPGTYPMAFEHAGTMVFTWEVQGQRGQHYGRHSYDETVAWMPARIELARREFSVETHARAAVR
jgi:hypothetical protein